MVLLTTLALLACRPSPPAASAPASPARPATDADSDISESTLRADLTTLAADSFRGRETGTPDAFRAARFLAERLRAIGAEPAGDSGYFQRVPLLREHFGPGTSFSVTEGGRSTPLALQGDVVPLLRPGVLGVGQGMFTKHRAEGDVVFAGYGLNMAPQNDLAGLDLEGKVVVVVNGAPSGADSATRAQLESPLGIAPRLERLLPLRPAAIVVLITPTWEPFYRQVAFEILRTVNPATPAPPTGEADRQLPMILLGAARPGSPLLPAGWPSDDRPRALAGRRFSGRIDVTARPFNGYNVVALIRGSDPALARTYVALGAHHDHIGITRPPAVGTRAVRGDSIANGADDNGSASVALLEIARALTRMARPLRSMLFVWHDAEEKGLLGSSYFVEHPTVPLDSIVAQINGDLIGRNGGAGGPPPPGAANTVYLIGPNSAPDLNRALGRIADSVNAAQRTPFTLSAEFDSLTHPQRPYYRSDHFSYARKGIPVAFFTTGLHEDYHQVTDEASKIDYAKLARVATLMRNVAIAVGNRRTRPR